MRLKQKISLLMAASTTFSAVLVAAGALYINFESGISEVDRKLDSLVSAIASTKEDPLSFALFAAKSQEITLVYQQSTGQKTVLQDSGGLLGDGHNSNRQVSLGYGEKLLISASQNPVYDTLYNSIWLTAALVLLTLAAAQLMSWAILSRDLRVINRLTTNAKEIAAGREASTGQVASSRDLVELVTSIEVMVGKLQKSKIEMQIFLEDVSHELKTPLTVMRGYLDILASSPDMDAEQTAKALDRSRSSVLRMQALVEDLMLLAELGETKEMQFEQVMLRDFLAKWSDDFAALQPNRPVQIFNNQTRPLEASSDLMGKFFTNVFANLQSHTSPQDAVRVSVEQTFAGVQVNIEDAGPGMSRLKDGQVLTVFDRFDKDHTKKAGSSGLGLSIMARIVELHNGQLQLSQSELGGVRVSAFFPADSSPTSKSSTI